MYCAISFCELIFFLSIFGENVQGFENFLTYSNLELITYFDLFHYFLQYLLFRDKETAFSLVCISCIAYITLPLIVQVMLVDDYNEKDHIMTTYFFMM